MTDSEIRRFGAVRRLVPTTFEDDLKRYPVLSASGTAWSESVLSDGLVIDLRRVEWIDLRPLVQLVCLVEAALRNGIRVELHPPSPRRLPTLNLETAEGMQSLVDSPERVLRRKKVRRYLNYLNFEKALRCDHLTVESNQLRITSPSGGKEAEKLYRLVFPLTWIDPADEHALETFSTFLQRVLSDPEAGLALRDVDALVNVVMFELAANVFEHAGEQRRALVTARAAASFRRLGLSEYLDHEISFNQWALENEASFVELLVGDSGAGVIGTLAGAYDRQVQAGNPVPTTGPRKASNILAWALDRWSSRKPVDVGRGTRGLYRIDRVATKYSGCLTIRCGEELLAADHGGAAFDVIRHTSRPLASLPGTVLHVRLPDITIYEPTWRAGTAHVPEPSVRLVRRSGFGVDGLPAPELEHIRQQLVSGGADSCLLLVVESGAISSRAMEAALRQLVEIRHPASIVVLNPSMSWSALEAVVESVNSAYLAEDLSSEYRRVESFRVWDPVLVVGRGGRFAWAGASQSLAETLSAVLAEPKGLSQTEIGEMVPDRALREEVLRKIRLDRGLCAWTSQGAVRCRLDLESALRPVVEGLRTILASDTDGILTEGPYLSPALGLSEKWIDMPRVLERLEMTSPLMLAAAVKANLAVGHSDAQLVVAESGANRDLVRELALHLDCPHYVIPAATETAITEVISRSTRGGTAFIFSEIVHTGEAVRRCAGAILRSGAQPAGVISLIDVRSDPKTTVNYWGIEIPVISLVECPLEVHAGTESATTPIALDPVSFAPEVRPPRRTAREDEGLRIIEEVGGIHLSHIRRPVGRHFTFYVDPTRLLNSPGPVKSLSNAVDDWKAKEALSPGDEITLWYAAREHPTDPGAALANELAKIRDDIYSITAVNRTPAFGGWHFSDQPSTVETSAVVILDWGTVTGNTVRQMVLLAAKGGARHVFSCVLLSQLPYDGEEFFASLKSLARGGRQLSLLEEDPSRSSECTVSCKFLARLPIGGYKPTNCPVCRQISRIRQESYPTNFLEQFAMRQLDERLRPRDLEDIVGSPPSDVDDRSLMVRQGVWMAKLQQLLHRSLTSTRARQECRRMLETIREEMAEDEPSHALALARLLTVETQWVRQPPLAFKACRDLLAEIAISLATDQQQDEADRVNALILLRTASKYQFVRSLPEILDAAIDSPVMCEQLAYDAFTYVARPYLQMPGVLRPMAESLSRMRRTVSEATLADDGLATTLASLENRVRRDLAEAQVRLIPPHEAFARLRQTMLIDFPAMAHELPTLSIQPSYEATQIEGYLAHRERGSSPSLDPVAVTWLQNLPIDLGTCLMMLERRVLPLLKRLRDVLMSPDGAQYLGEDRDHLLELLESGPPLTAGAFLRMLTEQAQADPENLVPRNWEIIRTELEFFYRVLLRQPTVDMVGRNTGSLLYEFLSSGPIDVAGRLPTLLGQNIRLNGGIELGAVDMAAIHDLEGFATEFLFSGLVSELLKNIRKQRQTAVDPELRVSASATETDIVIVFLNNGTAGSHGEGGGYAAFKRRLRAFGGQLEGTPATGSWATYQATIRLVRMDS